MVWREEYPEAPGAPLMKEFSPRGSLKGSIRGFYKGTVIRVLLRRKEYIP